MNQEKDGAIISALIEKLDSSIEGFVSKGYETMVGDHQGAIMLLVVLYFILLGYGMLSGKAELSGKSFVRHCLLVSVTYFLSVNWDIFSLLIYDFTCAIPSSLSSSIISATGVAISSGDLLDVMYKNGASLSAALFSDMNLSNMGAGFLALIVYVTNIAAVGYAALVICVAKMTMAVALSLAPAIVILFVFNGSRFVFDGWVRVLLTSMLSIIVIYSIVALTYILMDDYTSKIISKQHATFLDCGEYILFSFISMGLYMSSTRIAATIGGGFATEVSNPAAMALSAAGAIFSCGKTVTSVIGGNIAHSASYRDLPFAHEMREKLRK